MKMATAKPTRKVVAGAAGGVGFGSALVTLVVYALEQLSGEPLPSVVVAALAIVITAALGFASSYFTSPSPEDKVVQS